MPTRPQSIGDWVTVMRFQAEQSEGRRMGAKEAAQFTALQRQVAQTMSRSYLTDRQSAMQRQQDYAGHVVTLQRHPVSGQVARAFMLSVPQSERAALQRAVDEVSHQEALQRQQDEQALKLHTLQRQLAELNEQATKPVFERIQQRRGAGNPLPEAVQRHLEQGLNHDLSAVRIHDDAEADKLAKGVNAIAFTTGTDIYFQSGKFNPNSQSGLELLAHEVTHTVQQSKGQVGKGVDPDSGLESEARAMGRKLSQGFQPVIAPKAKKTKGAAGHLNAMTVQSPTQATALPKALGGRSAALQRSLWGAEWWQKFKDKTVENALEMAAKVPNAAPIVAAFKSSEVVFRKVLRNPVGFFNNLINSFRAGFSSFVQHIGAHLQGALLDWLSGTTFTGTGRMIAFPKSLDGRELLGFGMDMVGLNYMTLRGRLREKYGEAKVQKAEGEFALLKQAKAGLHTLNDFRAMDNQAKTSLLGAAQSFALTTATQQATRWAIEFAASSGLIPVAKTAFNLISTIIQNTDTFKSLSSTMLSGIGDIADGRTAEASKKVEANLGRVMGLVIKFFSKMAGLDKLGGAMNKALGSIKNPINKIIEKIVISSPVAAFFGKNSSTNKSDTSMASTEKSASSSSQASVPSVATKTVSLIEVPKNLDLHHGTINSYADSIILGGINLKTARNSMDFGKGFYLTKNQNHADGMAKRTSKRLTEDAGAGKNSLTHNQLIPARVVFSIDAKKLMEFGGKEFITDNEEWAAFVKQHRLEEKHHEYEFVYGPAASRYPTKNLPDTKVESMKFDKFNQISIHSQRIIEFFNHSSKHKILLGE